MINQLEIKFITPLSYFFFAVLLLAASCKNNSSAKAYELYLKGKEAFQRKNLSEAEQFFQDAVDKDSSLINAKLMIAKINYYNKEFDRAMKIISNILDEDEDHIGSLYWKARIIMINPDNDKEAGKKKEEEAVKSLQKVLEIDSHHISARQLLALIYEKRKMFKEAIFEYEAILQEQQSIINAGANLGILYKRLGLKDKSRGLIDTMIKMAEAANIDKNKLLVIKEEVNKL